MKMMIAVLALAASASVFASDVYVQGYTRANGTYVEGYHRTSPDHNLQNNYSTQGNTNPYTGQQGTVNPYPQQQIYQQPQPVYQQPQYQQPNYYQNQQQPQRIQPVCAFGQYSC